MDSISFVPKTIPGVGWVMHGWGRVGWGRVGEITDVTPTWARCGVGWGCLMILSVTMEKIINPIDFHCKNVGNLILSCHTWNIPKNCTSQIYKFSKINFIQFIISKYFLIYYHPLLIDCSHCYGCFILIIHSPCCIGLLIERLYLIMRLKLKSWFQWNVYISLWKAQNSWFPFKSVSVMGIGDWRQNLLNFKRPFTRHGFRFVQMKLVCLLCNCPWFWDHLA